MKAIHNLGDMVGWYDTCCVKLVKDNENESNSQPSQRGCFRPSGCVKLVKDNENESNSQQLRSIAGCCISCVGLVKDNENESNSQRGWSYECRGYRCVKFTNKYP